MIPVSNSGTLVGDRVFGKMVNHMRIRPYLLLTGILAASAFAQIPQGADELIFETHVGSFKILGGADPARGKITLSFTGTVLVNDLDGSIVIAGNVKKEFENKQRKEQCYFGTGTITVEGKFRSLQWFGRDMKANFKGVGIVRLNGEYDKNLDTGWVRYGNETKNQPWFQGGRQMEVPQPKSLQPVVPRARPGQ